MDRWHVLIRMLAVVEHFCYLDLWLILVLFSNMTAVGGLVLYDLCGILWDLVPDRVTDKD